MSEVDETYGTFQPDGIAERGVPPAAGEVIPAGARQEIESALSAFRQWLTRSEQWRNGLAAGGTLAGQESRGLQAPATDADTPGVDLHAVVKEWIALKQEVRLESRGSKASRERLDQAATAFHNGIDQVNSRLQETLGPLIFERDRLREEFQGQLESQLLQWVDLLLDVRDAR